MVLHFVFKEEIRNMGWKSEQDWRRLLWSDEESKAKLQDFGVYILRWSIVSIWLFKGGLDVISKKHLEMAYFGNTIFWHSLVFLPNVKN